MDEKDFRQAMKWYRRAPVTRVAPETGSLSAQPKKDISQREKARVWFPRDLPACSSKTETDPKREENSENIHSALTIYREKPVSSHSKTEKVEDAEAFNAPEIPLAETMSEDNPPYDVDYRTIRDDEGLLLEMSDNHDTQEEIPTEKTDSFSKMLASIETGIANMLAERPKLRHPSHGFSAIATSLAGVSEEDPIIKERTESGKQKDIDAEIAAELATLSEEELAEIAGFDLSLLRKDDDDNRPELSQQDVVSELNKAKLTEIAGHDLSLLSEVESEVETAKEDESHDTVISSESESDNLSTFEDVIDAEPDESLSGEESEILEGILDTGKEQPVIQMESEISQVEKTDVDMVSETFIEEDSPKPEESLFESATSKEEAVPDSSFADRITGEDGKVLSNSSADFMEEEISLEKANLFKAGDKTESTSDESDLLSFSEEIKEETSALEDLLEESRHEVIPPVIEDESRLSDDALNMLSETLPDGLVEDEKSSQEAELEEIAEQKTETGDDEQQIDISFTDETVESDRVMSDEKMTSEESIGTSSEEMESGIDTKEHTDSKDDFSPSESENVEIPPTVVDAILETELTANLESDAEKVAQDTIEPDLQTENTIRDTDAFAFAESAIAEDKNVLEETMSLDDSVSETETKEVSEDEKLEIEIVLSEEILSAENNQTIVVTDQNTELEKTDDVKDHESSETFGETVTETASSDQTDQIPEIIPVLSIVSEEDDLPKETEPADSPVTPDPENALADSILLAEGENPPDFDVPAVPVLDETIEKAKTPVPEEDVFREKMLSHQRNKMAFAEYKVAVAYARKNTEEARREMVKWYIRAAENGHAVSQFNLGNIYYAGRGVEQDYELAADWYEMAAKQGVARAQDNLGLMYFHGRGRFVDTELAVYWFHQAALQGYAPAQYKLAMHLEAGVGIESDLQEAMYWYQRAASQGDVNAQKALTRLEGNHDQ